MKYTIPVFLIVLSCTYIHAQAYIGGGFTYVRLSDRAFDTATGAALIIEKEVRISSSSNLRLHPSLQVSTLYSDYDRPFEPLYFNTISLSPKVSYRVLSGTKVILAPYASPFFSYLIGLQSGSPVFESSRIKTLKSGIEAGLMADLTVRGISFRFIPIAAQFGTNAYQQRMTCLLIRL